MRDRREEILERLTALGETFIDDEVPLFKTVARNEDNIPGVNRPGYIVLDGDEVASESDENRGRPPNAPSIMMMTPEVVLLLGKSAAAVGTDLNEIRRVTIYTIKNDATLRAAVGGNGEIRYIGLTTQFGSGKTMEGDMRLSFMFKYPLITSELVDLEAP